MQDSCVSSSFHKASDLLTIEAPPVNGTSVGIEREPLDASPDTARVLLVTMPYARPTGPSLALGLLKSILARDGIRADVLYGNLSVGTDLNYTEMLVFGETPVASLLMSLLIDGPKNTDEILDTIIAYADAHHGLNSEVWKSRSSLSEFVARCGEQLDVLARSIVEAPYDIIGFSLVFEQTPASIALAQRVKRAKPETTIVIGGASCDGEMGPALMSAYEFIDLSVSGNADDAIAPLVRAIRSKAPIWERVPGLSWRAHGAIRTNAAKQKVDLDSLPIPDFSDFFQQLSRSPLRSRVHDVVVPFEGSRGCWWGQKHLCSFCGLNAEGVAFRRKTPKRIYDEILELSRTYRATSLVATDNIIDMAVFKELLPAITRLREEEGFDASLFFEVKSNLRKQQIKALADAGVRFVQPGIESFSDHVLKLMDKGARAIQQIQFVKWCTEYGVFPAYNILIRNPDETVEDYRGLLELLPFITHLIPPRSAPFTIQLDRFSPYFMNPERYGIEKIRPAAVLKMTYRQPDDLLMKLVYRFEYEHKSFANDELRAVLEEFNKAIQAWRRDYRPLTLFYHRGPGFVRINDHRGTVLGDGPARVVTLTGLQADIFMFCDGHQSLSTIQTRFPDISETAIVGFLDSLIRARLMWRDGQGLYLSLPVRTSAGMPM